MAEPFQAVTAPFYHHSALRVRNMAAMLAFYRDVVGLPVIRAVGDPASPNAVWLHAVQLTKSDTPGDSKQGTLDHLAISVLNIRDIAASVTAQGVALEGPITDADFPALSLHLNNVFFRDPEGNRVELVQWTPLKSGNG